MFRITCGLGLFVLAACSSDNQQPPTQTIVFIDADPEVSATIATLQLGLTASDGHVGLARSVPTAGAWPIKLVAAPLHGDASRSFVLAVAALDAAGQRRFGALVEAGYVARQTRALQLNLFGSCLTPQEEPTFQLSPETLGSREAPVQLRADCNIGSGAPQLGDGGILFDASVSDAAAARDGAQPHDADAHAGDIDAAPAPSTAEDGGDASSRCAGGYEDNGVECVDINECERKTSGCEQGCLNAPGSFVCSCAADAWLKADAKSCARWHGTQRIDDGAGYARTPALAGNTSGDGLVIWSDRSSGMQPVLRFNRFAAGVGWTSPGTVGSGESALYAPGVALAKDGNGIAVWTQPLGTTGDLAIVSSNFVTPSTWTAPQQIATGGADLAVVGDELGNTFVGYVSGTTSERNQKNVIRFQPGTGWGTPSVLLPTAAGSAQHLRLAADSLGNAALVCVQGTTPESNTILSSVYQPSFGWLAYSTFPSRAPKTVLDPAIAMSATGGMAAVWTERAERDDIWFSFDTSVGWATPARFRPDDAGIVTSTMENSSEPAIAMSANGDAIAIWTENTRGRTGMVKRVYGTHYAGGGDWSEIVALSEYSLDFGPQSLTGVVRGDASNPKLAMDDLGNGAVVWSQFDGEGNRDHIFASRWSVGSGWISPVRLEQVDAADGRFPQVAFARAGSILVVWQQDQGTDSTAIWANRFD